MGGAGLAHGAGVPRGGVGAGVPQTLGVKQVLGGLYAYAEPPSPQPWGGIDIQHVPGADTEAGHPQGTWPASQGSRVGAEHFTGLQGRRQD